MAREGLALALVGIGVQLLALTFPASAAGALATFVSLIGLILVVGGAGVEISRAARERRAA